MWLAKFVTALYSTDQEVASLLTATESEVDQSLKFNTFTEFPSQHYSSGGMAIKASSLDQCSMHIGTIII